MDYVVIDNLWGIFCLSLTEVDYRSADILINVDSKEPSWWVWITDDTDPINIEEWSGIDDDSYLIISEEHVVEGVANFMARCIMSNPKALVYTPTHSCACVLTHPNINFICCI